jgi:Family of unknown function (DUF6152)
MEKSKALVFCALMFGLISFCVSLSAHHGNAAYQKTAVTVKNATVTKFVWANPHSIILFDAKDAKGNIVHWACETGSPSAMTLIGWNKNSLRPGDVITIMLYQAKSGAFVGRLSEITMAGGTTLRDSQQHSAAAK